MAIIFQDNFDSHADTCRTGGDVPTGWDNWGSTAASATKDSTTHYAGEISSTGRGDSGKSLKLWKHSDFTVTGDFAGLYGVSMNNGNVFIRYYQKLPTALDLTFNSTNGNYLKFWRFFTASTESDIYLDAVAPDSVNMRAGGALSFVDDLGYINAAGVIITAGNMDTTIWDGNWHCIEFQVGTNCHTLKFWLDGVEYFSSTSFDWGANHDQNITGLGHFGLGNYSSNYSWQSSWQAAEWDDLVIADAYIGPVSGGDTSKKTLFRK